jgi:hypothetical protein
MIQHERLRKQRGASAVSVLLSASPEAIALSATVSTEAVFVSSTDSAFLLPPQAVKASTIATIAKLAFFIAPPYVLCLSFYHRGFPIKRKYEDFLRVLFPHFAPLARI